MSRTAVRVQGLGKEYRIGGAQPEYRTFRDAVSETVRRPFRRAAKLLRGEAYGAAELDETIWALRDVSFEIGRGEVVGIIGKNGAGKSTLLKILSRITEPTEGTAEVRGRVGSLLEVGTGFHPELTGRENIYLNGAILGMRKAEIGRKFDEIVAFAEIERFLDTPVKHYSSGMHVRLAFAVAAHLDPEVLIIDEVLAVGDADFQKKCLGKMGEVAGAGRTVLFVSHDMGAITRLCTRAMWLNDGGITLTGGPAEVVAKYLTHGSSTAGTWRNAEPESGKIIILEIRVTSEDATPSVILGAADEVGIEVTYEVQEAVRSPVVWLRLIDGTGTIILTSWDTDSANGRSTDRLKGRYHTRCIIPGSFLRPGIYRVSVGAMTPNVEIYASHHDVVSFEVSSAGGRLNPSRGGVVAPILEWT